MMNILNGGTHSDRPLLQSQIVPRGAPSFSERCVMARRCIMRLKSVLKEHIFPQRLATKRIRAAASIPAEDA